MITLRELALSIIIILKEKGLKVDRATICFAVNELGYDYKSFTERKKRNLATAINKYINN